MRSLALTTKAKERQAVRDQEQRVKQARRAVTRLYLEARQELEKLAETRSDNHEHLNRSFGVVHLTAKYCRSHLYSDQGSVKDCGSWEYHAYVRIPEDMTFDGELLTRGRTIALPRFEDAVDDLHLWVCAQLATEIKEGMACLEPLLVEERAARERRDEEKETQVLYQEAEAKGRTLELVDQLLERS